MISRFVSKIFKYFLKYFLQYIFQNVKNITFTNATAQLPTDNYIYILMQNIDIRLLTIQ